MRFIFIYFLNLFYFIYFFISWRLITSQYCSGFWVLVSNDEKIILELDGSNGCMTVIYLMSLIHCQLHLMSIIH